MFLLKYFNQDLYSVLESFFPVYRRCSIFISVNKVAFKNTFIPYNAIELLFSWPFPQYNMLWISSGTNIVCTSKLLRIRRVIPQRHSYTTRVTRSLSAEQLWLIWEVAEAPTIPSART